MAKKPAAPKKTPTPTASSSTTASIAVPRPRLHKLIVSNFRCIGSAPVEIELDDIVVLVGPNNAGKSSILRAYEVVMLEQDKEGNLTADDFPEGKPSPSRLPTIILDTVVSDENKPADTWVAKDAVTGEMHVLERWIWDKPGAPTRRGFDVAAKKWHDTSFPWGPGSIAQAARPKPHRVGAFDSPEKQAEQVAKLLKEALKASLTGLKTPTKTEDGGTVPTEYHTLLGTIKKLRTDLASDALRAVEEVRASIEKIVSEVFTNYRVSLDARPEEDIEAAVDLLAGTPVVKMGPANGYHAPMANQGSGARRTLLWAALRILAERGSAKAGASGDRSHVLLMDEPELCLHPDAIREACRVLYDLPKTKTWQVMITTHSPVFIDLSRDNTSIVRVERNSSGVVKGTTIYRPKRARLDDDDRAELKLLNMCDPHVAEFFFGGRTIIVEGDTEFTAFRYVIASDPARYKDVRVVRARGKACVKSLCKILNQFESGYAVLHDSDRPVIRYKKKLGTMTNPMWTENLSILDTTQEAQVPNKVLLAASVPNFEEAFFGSEVAQEKPYAAWSRLRTDDTACAAVAGLLDALVDPTKALPKGAVKWSKIEELAAAVAAFDSV